MIFRPTLARAVATGRKTQTRRPVTNKPCRYKIGHDYAVQPGRGKTAIARLKVLDLREERVGQITHQDAKAEGFRNAAAFKAYWVSLYDKAWVEKLEADITPELGEGLSESELVYRFEVAHAHKLVTVITFELVQDAPRFLAVPGQGDVTPLGNADYTRQRHRAVDDLEVIDEATQARYSKAVESFCIGRQIARSKGLAEAQAQRKAERGRMFRQAA